MTIKQAIKKEKDKLVKKCYLSGLYENFGQKEVRKLEDKYIDSSCYSEEMNSHRDMLDNFNNWCMNYKGDLK